MRYIVPEEWPKMDSWGQNFLAFWNRFRGWSKKQSYWVSAGLSSCISWNHSKWCETQSLPCVAYRDDDVYDDCDDYPHRHPVMTTWVCLKIGYPDVPPNQPKSINIIVYHNFPHQKKRLWFLLSPCLKWHTFRTIFLSSTFHFYNFPAGPWSRWCIGIWNPWICSWRHPCEAMRIFRLCRCPWSIREAEASRMVDP